MILCAELGGADQEQHGGSNRYAGFDARDLPMALPTIIIEEARPGNGVWCFEGLTGIVFEADAQRAIGPQ